MIRTSKLGCITLMIAVMGCEREAKPTAPGVATVDTLTVELEIGSAESEGADAFGKVSSIVADNAGRILVADAQNNEVRVFTSTGDFAFKFGGSGAGPGELSAPCCMAWAPTGDLWIRDTGNGRFSVFNVGDTAATFVTTVRMEHGDADRMVPTTFRGTNEFADIGSGATADNGRGVHRQWRSLDGKTIAVDTITAPSMEELGGQLFDTGQGVRFFLYQPFGAVDLMSFGPDGLMAEGISSKYAIRVTRRDGQAVLAGPDIVGPTLSDAERERGSARLETLAKRTGKSASALPFALPEHKPPLRQTFFDQTGRLWAELSAAEGAAHEAHVWMPTGTRVNTYQWPADVSLSPEGWVGKDVIVGVKRDSLGVDYVVRLGTNTRR